MVSAAEILRNTRKDTVHVTPTTEREILTPESESSAWLLTVTRVAFHSPVPQYSSELCDQ